MSSPTLSGVAISGTGGQFTCTATTIAVGHLITITGTLGGTGTITGYATNTTYKVSAITGSGSSVTGFTLTTTLDVAIVTTAGTPTGLTYTNASNQSVASVTVTAGGSGYKGTVTASFSTGNASAGSVTVASSSISGATITTVGSGYSSPPSLTVAAPPSGTTASLTGTLSVAGLKIINGETYNTNYVNGAGVVGPFAAKYPGTLGNSLKVSICGSVGFTGWTYASEFDSVPGTSTYASSVGGTTDELHIIVIDEDGAISGTQGTILEKFAFVSKASDAKKPDGTNNYYKNVLNSRSEYIWWMDHPTGGTGTTPWGSAAAGASFQTLSPLTVSLSGGTDDYNASDAELLSAYELFAIA
jgi:hypothetical protein